MRETYKNPAIHKALDILETLSADETVRHLARVREDALRNERSELFHAEKRGLEKGRREGARKGRLIGKSHAAQRFLKRRITPEKKLLERSISILQS